MSLEHLTTNQMREAVDAWERSTWFTPMFFGFVKIRRVHPSLFGNMHKLIDEIGRLRGEA